MRKARTKSTSSSILKAFTLIEVMVAVVIISVVIMALIKLFANNTHIFSSLNAKSKNTQYLSFLVSPSDYGFEDKEITLYDLVKEFDIESELKRDLKNIKVKLLYQEVDTIDTAEYDFEAESKPESEAIEDNKEERANSNMIFEIGKTVLKVEDSSLYMLRIKQQ